MVPRSSGWLRGKEEQEARNGGARSGELVEGCGGKKRRARCNEEEEEEEAAEALDVMREVGPKIRQVVSTRKDRARVRGSQAQARW